MKPLYWNRTKMNNNFLFFKKETYNLITRMYSDRVIDRLFEEASMEDADYRKQHKYLFNGYIIDKLKELDEKKIMTLPGVYIFNLFYFHKEPWGSRGTPYLWQAIAREFPMIIFMGRLKKFLEVNI